MDVLIRVDESPAVVTSNLATYTKLSLDKSGWLKHIRSILDGALMIVQVRLLYQMEFTSHLGL